MDIVSALKHEPAYLQRRLKEVATENPLTYFGLPFRDVSMFGDVQNIIEPYKQGYRIFTTQAGYPSQPFTRKKLLADYDALITFSHNTINVEIKLKPFHLAFFIFWTAIVSTMFVLGLLAGNVIAIFALVLGAVFIVTLRKEKKRFTRYIIDLLNGL